MPTYPWIEFPLCALTIVGPVFVIYCRFRFKKIVKMKDRTTEERPWGIGVRMIQLIALLILGPLIAILALEEKLSGEGTGTLLGAVVGYALGGIAGPVPKEGS
jgi:hypothetical protein